MLLNRPMKLARPGVGKRDRGTVLASTPSFERSLEAARPGSLSLVLGLLERGFLSARRDSSGSCVHELCVVNPYSARSPWFGATLVEALPPHRGKLSRWETALKSPEAEGVIVRSSRAGGQTGKCGLGRRSLGACFLRSEAGRVLSSAEVNRWEGQVAGASLRCGA